MSAPDYVADAIKAAFAKPKKISLVLEVDAEKWLTFCEDILTCAVEGGINYWAQCEHIVFDDEKNRYVSVTVTEHEPNEDNLLSSWTITPEVIATGVERMLRAQGNGELRGIKSYAEAVSQIEENEYDLDAYDCDACLQMAIFAEVVYG